MPNDKILATVIIPHLNQPDALEACLAGLDAQPHRHAFEVIVVDNGSDALPRRVIDRHPGTRLLLERRPGPGLARNRGVQAAQGQILCFIDADCRPDPNWVKVALELLEEPSKTVYGGDVRIWKPCGNVTSIAAYESVFAYRFQMYVERQGYCGTGNMAVRKADFDKVGAFAGVDVAEDVEWGARARRAGLTFRYQPRMIVYHPARQTLRELFAKWDRHIQHALNAERHKGWWRTRWLSRAFAVLISPLRDVARVLASERLEGVSARLKAIGVLVLLRVYRAWRMAFILFSERGVLWNRAFEIQKSKGETVR
jgi:GT2 family glycosyltransferase